MKSTFNSSHKIITIGGDPVSGKSMLGRRLAKLLDYPFFDMGEEFRRLAEAKGLTLEEFRALCQQDPKVDQEIDVLQRELAEQAGKAVIVGRTSFHFLPDGLSLFIGVPVDIAAERLLKDKRRRNEGNDLSDLDSVKQSLEKRKAEDEERYKRYYGIDIYNKRNYKLVFSSEHKNADQLLEAVRTMVVN